MSMPVDMLAILLNRLYIPPHYSSSYVPTIFPTSAYHQIYNCLINQARHLHTKGYVFCSYVS